MCPIEEKITTMKNYYIVGAGGFGREIYHILQARILLDKQLSNIDTKICGFLDDDFFALSAYKNYPPVLCEIQEYIPKESDLVIVAVGVPTVRRKIVKILRERNVSFSGLVHPHSFFYGQPEIGQGVFVGWNVLISCDVTLGNFISLNGNMTIGHDAVIEDYVEVGPGCAVSGFAHIEEGVHIGSGCVIAPGVRVGAWSKVSANSAVMRDVPPFSYVTGVPGTTLPNFFKHPDGVVA